jgi:uncharacterized protein (TIGR02246 family)
MTNDESAIRELIEAWMVASKTGDHTAVLEMMTDDVIFMTPGGRPFGKEAFAAASENMKNVKLERTQRNSGTKDFRRLRLSAELHRADGAAFRRRRPCASVGIYLDDSS